MSDVAFAPLASVRRTWKHSFLEGWRWGKDTTDWFVQETSRLDLERPVLHICSGSSKLGDVRVDAVHDAANLKADMFHLPFPDHSFPVVVIDPPYELNLQDRCKLAKELARVHRPGGRLLWKAPWLPHEGFYQIHDVTVQSIRAGLPRDAHLLVRATRRTPSSEPRKGNMKKAADRKLPALGPFGNKEVTR